MLPENFWIGACGSFMFGVVGLILFFIAYFAFDKITPKLNVEAELEKGNMAVGVVVGSLLIALAIVVSSVLH